MLLIAGLDPRVSVAEYPVKAKAGPVEVGAEYLVRSMTVRTDTIDTDKYLVVEVGFYPPKDTALTVTASSFTLRINGKTPLLAQSPSIVAAQLKDPEWERDGGGFVAGAGPITIGRPTSRPRFPGDQSDPQSRRRPIPQAPDGATTVEREDVRTEDLVLEGSLPEGPARGPVRGYLFFYYKGKAKSIKSVELLYQPPGVGQAPASAPLTLKLL